MTTMATAVGTRPLPHIHPLQSLYHIPATLSNFTVDYLSKLFSAVDKPNSQLKIPTRQPDNRKFPDFRSFIRTLLINGRISADTLVHALIYLSRFHRRAFRKQAIVEDGAKHKLFLAALLVASKFCDDRYPLATITVCEFLPQGLLMLEEVNRMERAFLGIIRYKLIVDPDELALLLGKHGIDIKHIANVISQRLNGRPAAIHSQSQQKQQQLQQQQQQQQPMAVGALVSGGIPQRAQAGHSTSARTVRSGSIGLIGAAAPQTTTVGMVASTVPVVAGSAGATTVVGTARLTTASSSSNSNSSRNSNSANAIITSTHTLPQSAGPLVLHNAYLESATDKRPRRASKPLPSTDRLARQREPLALETMFKQPLPHH
ncbi:PHO85 cyclin-1 [Coemansia erecta]|nr:PHO85 cyclin-1 [Coemansia erecta]